VRGEFLDEEAGDRDRATLVVLRRALHQLPGDLGERHRHRHPAPQHVEPGHPQRRRLAPSQTCVRQEPHQQAVPTAGVRERGDLVVVKEHRFLPHHPG
jgi:hypothetical protein